jgi:fructokinase
MGKIVCVGEVLLDIIIEGNKPVASIPGGSVLNSAISMARLGASVEIVSETGKDKAGEHIVSFLETNNIATGNLSIYNDRQTAIALAYLDSNKNASYTFYKDYPDERLSLSSPVFKNGDFLLFGSSFSINPATSKNLSKIVSAAQASSSSIYYDPNVRLTAKNIDSSLWKRNLKSANIVRGSDEDFKHIFGHDDIRLVYEAINSPILDILICTRGGGTCSLHHNGQIHNFDPPQTRLVSTIGAGDNFNAGFIFAANEINTKKTGSIEFSQLSLMVETGLACASSVCSCPDNYIASDFASVLSAKVSESAALLCI